MPEIETRDERHALQIASDGLDRYMDAMDREVFRAGWLASREWHRAQERQRLQGCQHRAPCPTADHCYLRTED